ncbi:hypothetical protein BGZ65_009346 [Modicella reniformis]|uniref:Uncharacterized protein n=1 Tax=Modicella reniformis TaxID=1440133 RepID=A0A9P6JGV3_9FUNG|nr:hypothetical protein BGZ65_009346 [Modicella reniformis]
MEKMFPMIEIRYINSFEPHHVRQELKEEPCIHNLSWIHYWSAAKESQVLQSKVVNEVVRVRPMWINNDHLHRNYTLPVPSVSALPPTDALSFSNSSIPTSPSVYIGSEGKCSEGLEDSLCSTPLTVSIASILNADTNSNVYTLADDGNGHRDDSFENGFDRGGDRNRVSYRGSSRTFLSRAQSSLDILHDSAHGQKFPSRRLKKWSISLANGEKGSYRHSIPTPLPLLMKDDISRVKSSSSNKNGEANSMSSPPLSPVTLTSTLALTMASTASLPANGSLGIGNRLVGLVQRLGMYKLKGSPLVMVHL